MNILQELMKLMGLPNWLYWLNWFLTAATSAFFSVLIMVILICVEWVPGMGQVLDFSAPLLTPHASPHHDRTRRQPRSTDPASARLEVAGLLR